MPAPAYEDLPALLSAAEAAAAARDPEALADAVAALTGWVHATESFHFDEIYARWPEVRHVFTALDLSIWKRGSPGVATLALALARVDYYRQLDLGIDERFALLTRVRGLLSARDHLACARVDLERAELASLRASPEDIDRALALCDDALASVEQLEDEAELADALLTRAHVLARGERWREATQAAEKARVIYAKREMTHSLANITNLIAELYCGAQRIPDAAITSAEAIDLYRRAKDSVGEANALMIRAWTWRARGKPPKGIADCERAVMLYELVHLRTSQGRAMLVSADLLAAEGRTPDAHRAIDAAVRFLRESPETYHLVVALLRLAGACLRRGDEGGAVAALDEAEAAIARVGRDRERAWALLEICRTAKELPTPDRPRLRRCSAQALALARELKSTELEDAARSFAAFAG